VLLRPSLRSSRPGPAHGHDHGDAAPAAVGQALPRFSAVSEAFELVGVLSGKQITLYLDRFADNSPVRGAQIELEIGGAKFKAEKQGEDEYEVVLPNEPKPGVLPVAATVIAGNETDLLAGELDIHEEAHTEEAALRCGLDELRRLGRGRHRRLGLAPLGWASCLGRAQRSRRRCSMKRTMITTSLALLVRADNMDHRPCRSGPRPRRRACRAQRQRPAATA
jgi:hypothetical protein